MKKLTYCSVALAMLLSLGIGPSVFAAKSRSIDLEGRVLQINKAERTLLVRDMWSEKLYLVKVPERASFRITFGLYMRVSDPEFWQVGIQNKVRMRCTRDGEHYVRLENGREAAVLIAQSRG